MAHLAVNRRSGNLPGLALIAATLVASAFWIGRTDAEAPNVPSSSFATRAYASRPDSPERTPDSHASVRRGPLLPTEAMLPKQSPTPGLELCKQRPALNTLPGKRSIRSQLPPWLFEFGSHLASFTQPSFQALFCVWTT